MLRTAIERERQRAEHEILQYYREQYHPFAVLLPNARFGLYTAAKELLSPGDQVIISPITCRTVIDALLAAEVTPVFVDIESETGNIDSSHLPLSLLKTARAIVTTNLYGNPDDVLELRRLAARHGLLLIEDCAHVVHTVIDGHRIGAVGDVSVFSFKKHFGEPGGVITLRDEAAARKVQARVAEQVEMPPEGEDRLRFVQLLVQQATPPSMAACLSRIGRSLTRTARNEGGRPAATPGTAMTSRPTFALTASLTKVAGCISHLDVLIAEKMRAARDLIARCPLPLKRSPWSDDVCYLVVPFFSPERDSIVEALKLRGVPVYFLYTPPMNEVFHDRLPSGEAVHSGAVDDWRRNILPINPRFANECLDVLNQHALAH